MRRTAAAWLCVMLVAGLVAGSGGASPALAAAATSAPMEAAPTVTATVAAAGTVTGRVIDAEGKAVSGAMVEVFQPGAGLVAVVRSDTAGRYAATVPTATPLRAQATFPGLATAVTGPETPGAGIAASLQLQPASRIVSGKVLDAKSDRPLPGAQVDLAGSGLFRTMYTDATGAFAFRQVPVAGTHKLLASAAGYRLATASPGSNLQVKLTAAAPAAAQSAGTLTGAVRASGRPLAGATVHVLRPDTGDVWSTDTDLRGSYSLSDLPAGTGVQLLAWAEAAGAAPQALDPLELAAGKPQERGFSLTPDTGSIGGVVTAAGRPLPGATVYLFWSGVGNVAATVTDAAGTYSFTDVPAETGTAYWVRAVADGFLPGGLAPAGDVREPAPVPAGSRLALDVGLSAGTAAFDADPPAVGITLRRTATLVLEGEAVDLSPLETTAWVSGQSVPVTGGRFQASFASGQEYPYLAATVQDRQGNLGGAVAWLQAAAAETVTTIRLTIGQNFATVNGRARYLDPAPVIMAGRTMVPLRWLGEALGAKVGYDAGARRVTYTLGGRSVELWIDKTTARVGNQDVTLDTAPVILQGRTMVPLRFVGSALGARVQYNAADQSITLTYPE